LDALIAEVKKMDAEKAAAGEVEVKNNRGTGKRSRSTSKAKEIPSTPGTPVAAAAAPAIANVEAPVVAESVMTASASAASLSKEQKDYKEVKTNYDNMFEEFETDILLSMEEMQKMGKTSDKMEERLNAVQSRSSNQSHRFRAVKESYKALGQDLENRLKKMMKKKEEEKEEKTEEVREEKKEMELQNVLMSSLEGKMNEAVATGDDDTVNGKTPSSLQSPIEDEGDLTDKEADLTDKGYTLTDDAISDDLDGGFSGIKRKSQVEQDAAESQDLRMTASMFETSTTQLMSESDGASMTASTISWGDALEDNESTNAGIGGKAVEDLTVEQKPLLEASSIEPQQQHVPSVLVSRQIVVGSCISEDSGLSDSKASDPYDPYKGKKKRKQRPRVKSMIEI